MQIRTSPSDRISALASKQWQGDQSAQKAEKPFSLDLPEGEVSKPEPTSHVTADRPGVRPVEILESQGKIGARQPQEERSLLTTMTISNRVQRALDSYVNQQNQPYRDVHPAFNPLAGVDFYA